MLFDLLYWDEGQILYTKGHHDKEAFCQRAAEVYPSVQIEPDVVSHVYARWCGYFDWWDGGKYKGQYLDYPVPQKRGAFPITLAQQFECDESVYEEYGTYCHE